ncbi:nucleotide pyrophosphatase [Halorubrum sp. CBA1125]|uniref:alkaline phosphatase family protein n=1 Tax=Halorubrum sp. CBA1125 TaxID=2668072 RepID=UPI0012E9477F|nr:alkaline phosphatase family protein [Halorubrum sp. CBA1125]MUW13430.1 nucleotide pyrophosphatase [Halorubrum sp. CBA1125]
MVQSIVLGLDGANWDLLSPWLDSGDLPNIQLLREHGTVADLESCLPPVTCPNWRCYSTGKNPGKLGVYWWEKIDTENRTLSTPTSRSFKSANYWDYLAEDGVSTGVVNLPMTYPPLPMEDGYLVAGGPGSEQDNYTDPAELEAELEERSYQLHPDSPITSQDDRDVAADIVDLIDERLTTFRSLLDERDVDIAHCTVFYINVLQHYFWRGEPTAEAWQVIDQHIGAIREEYPEATLYLMSDHGCAEIDTMFYANSWLEEEGFLETKTSGTTSVLERFDINKQRISKLADRVGVRGVVAALAPERIKQAVPEDDEGAKRDQKLDRIDWEQSRAVASGQGLIYVIDGKKETRDHIIDRLSSLKSEISGIPIAQSVYRREEVYEGPYVSEAPTIVFDQTPGVHTSGAIGPNPVFEDVSHWSAENVRTGLFLADGPDVTGTAEDRISITDIAPTILHEHGSAIPSDMDGEPLGLFDYDQPGERDPIVPDFVDQRSDESVQNRLEDLGYLQ